VSNNTEGVRIRMAITKGDEKEMLKSCEHFGCTLDVGGPPEPCDYWFDDAKRVEPKGGMGWSDNWVMVYIRCPSVSIASAVRRDFINLIGEPGG